MQLRDVVEPIDRLVVVGLRIEADPVLAEVRAAISSPRNAWPMCEPKSRMPGWARNSRLARVTIRRSSGMEVPGAVIQCIKKSRSLNPGKSSSPSRGATARPMSRTAATVRKAEPGRRMSSASAAP
jgi:hypothetical protein